MRYLLIEFSDIWYLVDLMDKDSSGSLSIELEHYVVLYSEYLPYLAMVVVSKKNIRMGSSNKRIELCVC